MKIKIISNLILMSLIENQTFKTKICYFHNEDDTQKVTIGISVNFNHEAPSDIIHEIEKQLDCLFLNDYVSEATHKKMEEIKKQHLKQKNDADKQRIKNEKERLKHEKEQAKREKERLKQEKMEEKVNKVKDEVEKIEKKSKKKEQEEYVMPVFT